MCFDLKIFIFWIFISDLTIKTASLETSVKHNNSLYWLLKAVCRSGRRALWSHLFPNGSSCMTKIFWIPVSDKFKVQMRCEAALWASSAADTQGNRERGEEEKNTNKTLLTTLKRECKSRKDKYLEAKCKNKAASPEAAAVSITTKFLTFVSSLLTSKARLVHALFLSEENFACSRIPVN